MVILIDHSKWLRDVRILGWTDSSTPPATHVEEQDGNVYLTGIVSHPPALEPLAAED